jgi:cell division transport system permease protein
MSGVLAWFIVTVLMLILRQSVEKVSELYQGVFHIMFLGITETFALLLISSALGVLGSWAVLFYQLRHTNPR